MGRCKILLQKTDTSGIAALNTLVSFGVSFAISWGIEKISELINKEKEAAAEAERLRQEQAARRQQLIADIKAYDEENKAIDSCI